MGETSSPKFCVLKDVLVEKQNAPRSPGRGGKDRRAAWRALGWGGDGGNLGGFLPYLEAQGEGLLSVTEDIGGLLMDILSE